MKRQFLYFLLLFSLFSCQEDVKFNNPSFQSIKDNVFWRAVNYKTTLSGNGVLLIEAYTRNEIVTLKTSSNAVDTYELGISNSNTATYKVTDNKIATTFSTGIGFGDGEIVITEYDALNRTVSGTFKFNVDNVDNNPLYGSSINFQNGFFYKIPLN